ncbi:MAG: MXAN_2562 family outer membrane beta-barrel protein [Nitrospirota bacterium]|nr:MXAN_2562 family outer membrane beta-barrel protein [Nitrospirota bacterium]
MRAIILLIAAVLLLPAAGHAASSRLDQPNWSLEVKGGNFYPEIDNWKDFYGRDHTWHYAGSLAYKVLRQVEAGIEAGYIKDRGQGYAPLNSQAQGVTVLSGRVTYELAPINVFVLFRGMFSDDQWLVPYAGGGYTRMFYREKIESQGAARGYVNGYHGRAGLQFLLDGIDSSAANNLFQDYGVHHTYLFVELEITKAALDNSSMDLGGKSYLAGFLFEF